jgi:hypothetical protein
VCSAIQFKRKASRVKESPFWDVTAKSRRARTKASQPEAKAGVYKVIKQRFDGKYAYQQDGEGGTNFLYYMASTKGPSHARWVVGQSIGSASSVKLFMPVPKLPTSTTEEERGHGEVLHDDRPPQMLVDGKWQLYASTEWLVDEELVLECASKERCQVASGGLWSQCSAMCDEGQQSRTRRIVQAAAYGGKRCDQIPGEPAGEVPLTHSTKCGFTCDKCSHVSCTLQKVGAHNNQHLHVSVIHDQKEHHGSAHICKYSRAAEQCDCKCYDQYGEFEVVDNQL